MPYAAKIGDKLSITDFGYDFDDYKRNALQVMCGKLNLQVGGGVKADYLFAIELYYGEQRAKQGRQDRRYLDLDFNPNSYTKAQLRQVLTLHHIQTKVDKDKVTKKKIIPIFEAEIESMRREMPASDRAEPEDLGLNMAALSISCPKEVVKKARTAMAVLVVQRTDYKKLMGTGSYERIVVLLRSVLDDLDPRILGKAHGKSHTAARGGLRSNDPAYHHQVQTLMIIIGVNLAQADKHIDDAPERAIQHLNFLSEEATEILAKLA